MNAKPTGPSDADHRGGFDPWPANGGTERDITLIEGLDEDASGCLCDATTPMDSAMTDIRFPSRTASTAYAVVGTLGLVGSLGWIGGLVAYLLIAGPWPGVVATASMALVFVAMLCGKRLAASSGPGALTPRRSHVRHRV